MLHLYLKFYNEINNAIFAAGLIGQAKMKVKRRLKIITPKGALKNNLIFYAFRI